MLANDYVIYEILEHLSLFPQPITSFQPLELLTGEDLAIKRRTLASVALVCRALAEPASRILWQVVHVGLLPLFRTLSCLK